MSEGLLNPKNKFLGQKPCFVDMDKQQQKTQKNAGEFYYV